MERTDGERVEVLVGVVLHDEFHGKRLRFTGREVDRYDTSESRHVLYECGPGRYRILVSRFDDGCEIYPVETIDQGMELLTGMPAGERDERGEYPDGSTNALVESRLAELTEQQLQFARAVREE